MQVAVVKALSAGGEGCTVAAWLLGLQSSWRVVLTHADRPLLLLALHAGRATGK